MLKLQKYPAARFAVGLGCASSLLVAAGLPERADMQARVANTPSPVVATPRLNLTSTRPLPSRRITGDGTLLAFKGRRA